MLPTIFPVTSHTKHVGKGSTFVAINGFNDNGERYIPQAIEQGATTIICKVGLKTDELEKTYPHVRFEHVENTRTELASRAAQALGHPASTLKIIGITGTSGKTTTAYALWHTLTQLGVKTALLGTVKAQIGEKTLPSQLTTPSADELHMFFAQCAASNVTHVVMEVSSHALSLERVHGILFDVACFSNLSPEHLDFYATMEDYFAAKTLLFDQIKPGGHAIINTDDDWGKKLFDLVHNQKRLPSIAVNQEAIARHNFTSPLIIGAFNAYNTTMAGLACQSLGLENELIKSALATFAGAPGRMEMVELHNNIRACIDYAHKPGAMETVLATLRGETSQLIVIFGCGGNKDPYKRSVMGSIAQRYGDIIIITNDNPRNEDPQKIADDIRSGISGKATIFIELDRKAAIEKGVSLAKQGACLAILGKGHEDTMVIKGVKYLYNDRDIVAAIKKRINLGMEPAEE